MRRSPAPFRVARLVALGALVCLGGAGPASADQFTRFERERARMILKIIKDDIGRFYYDPAYRGVDLDAAFSAAGEKIDAAESNGQCFAAIARPLLTSRTRTRSSCPRRDPPTSSTAGT